jgi:hypothetical protein
MELITQNKIKAMAKKKEDSAEESERKKSIGSQLKSKTSQRERNLSVKAEMIERGERDFPQGHVGETTKERNLSVKEEQRRQQAEQKPQGDEKEKDETKSKGKK